jgi:hypothetical protein
MAPLGGRPDRRRGARLVAARFDPDRFLSVLTGADMLFLALVPLAIMGEQLVRAWKWRQLLLPIRSVGTAPLFDTIMAGYLLGMLVPFGFGTVARPGFSPVTRT